MRLRWLTGNEIHVYIIVIMWPHYPECWSSAKGKDKSSAGGLQGKQGGVKDRSVMPSNSPQFLRPTCPPHTRSKSHGFNRELSLNVLSLWREELFSRAGVDIYN